MCIPVGEGKAFLLLIWLKFKKGIFIGSKCPVMVQKSEEKDRKCVQRLHRRIVVTVNLTRLVASCDRTLSCHILFLLCQTRLLPGKHFSCQRKGTKVDMFL